MSLSNSSLSDFRAVELNTIALDILQNLALDVGGTMVEVSLSSLSFGALTMLSFTSVYFLTCRGSVAPTNAKILLLGTVVLYVSTAIYMAAFIWAWSNGYRAVSRANQGLFSPNYDGRGEVAAFNHALRQQSWMMSVALGLNFVIGDATVWWRVCVIWQHKSITCVGLLLVTSTMSEPRVLYPRYLWALPDLPNVFGIIGMLKSRSTEAAGLILLIGGNAYAQASASLSLATNVLATLLMAYKAWEHRQLLKRHFSREGTTSRVFKALALLVESGCIYSALLIFVIVYQAETLTTRDAGSVPVFTTVAADFTYGCLVPIVAIYPALIIVLAALKRSPIDNGGLSGAHSVHGRRPETADVGASSTIVFHHSTFRGSAGGEADIPTNGIPVTDSQSMQSLALETSSEGETKDFAGYVA